MDSEIIVSRYYMDPKDSVWLKVARTVLEERGDIRFIEMVLHSLARTDHSKKEREILIDEYLTFLLLKNKTLPEAQAAEFSAELLELSNHSVTTRGTRGSILIDLGRTEEGKEILTHVLAETTSNIDREFSLVFLSIAEERLGNLELADRYAKEALALPPSTFNVRNRLTGHTRARLRVAGSI